LAATEEQRGDGEVERPLDPVEAVAESARRRRPTGRVRQLERPEERRVPIDYLVYLDTLEELCFAAGYREEPSLAVLDGEFGLDEEGPFLELTGFSSLQYTGDVRGLYPSLKSSIQAELAHRDGDGEPTPYPVAGFFVGVRGSEGRLDASIARIHLSLMNIPYQVAAVFDPQTDQFGLYARDRAGKFQNVAMAVIEDVESHSERVSGEES
jgi:hypothetical protein